DILRNTEEEIIEYGFLWDQEDNPRLYETTPQIEAPTVSFYLIQGSPEGSGFSYSITGGLLEGKTYYCRCYARTGSTEVNGNVISFVARGSKAPVIKGFSPESGEYEDRVKIWGDNFSQSIARTRVKFGDKEVSVDSIGADEIYVRVPWITKTEKVKISVGASGMEGISEGYFEQYYPWYLDTDFASECPGDINYWFETGGLLYGISQNGSATSDPGSTWVYNPATSAYTKVSDAPALADEFIVDHFRIDSRIFLLVLNISHEIELWEYVPSADEWTRKADFPGLARRGFTATGLGGKAVVSLGYAGQSGITSIYETWEYDAATDEWERKADFPLMIIDNATGIAFNNTVYMCACNLVTGIKIYKYSQSQNQWEYITDYPGRSTSDILAFSAAGRLFFGFGSNNYSEYRTEINEYFPEMNTWEPYITVDKIVSGLHAFSGTEKAFVVVKALYDYIPGLYEFIPPGSNIK
ncbi:MAG: IPT/TIG domain-containing protein, partial [Marinilabiliaceae bacterium]|nr:IPT/TIG domain-containing protein [Marinilabiliaceae bacterium]